MKKIIFGCLSGALSIALAQEMGVSDSAVKNPDAVKYQELTFERALDENLRIMDQTAFTLCSENNMNIIVYDSTTKGNLIKLLDGENVGTTIHN